MALAEKRRIAEIKETVLPGIEKELADKLGATIKLSVDWDSIDADSMKMLNDIVYYFKRMDDGVMLVASDSFGKAALLDTVKEIRMVHNPNKLRKISLQDGVALVSCTLADSLSYNYNIPAEFRKDLEKVL